MVFVKIIFTVKIFYFVRVQWKYSCQKMLKVNYFRNVTNSPNCSRKQRMASQSWSMAQVTDLLTSTAEISNLMSVVVVLAGLLVMLVFLLKLICQVSKLHL